MRLPTTPEERTFAYDALRLADQEMDLAFAQAVRRASTQPPVKSAEVTQLNDQLQQALGAAAADQVQSHRAHGGVAKAGPSAVQALTDRLELAKAQLALDQDEVDDARQDLQRAGGDPQGRIQSIVAEHEAASRASDSTRIVITRAPEPHGMLGAADALFTLRDKAGQLDAAKHTADSLAARFKQRHDSIEARVARMVDSANAHLTHDSAAALLELTRSRAASEKRRATLDQRMDNQNRLSDTYAGWSAVVSSQARAHVQPGAAQRGGDSRDHSRGDAARALVRALGARARRGSSPGADAVHDRPRVAAGHRRAVHSSHRLRSAQRRRHGRRPRRRRALRRPQGLHRRLPRLVRAHGEERHPSRRSGRDQRRHGRGRRDRHVLHGAARDRRVVRVDTRPAAA